MQLANFIAIERKWQVSVLYSYRCTIVINTKQLQCNLWHHLSLCNLWYHNPHPEILTLQLLQWIDPSYHLLAPN